MSGTGHVVDSLRGKKSQPASQHQTNQGIDSEDGDSYDEAAFSEMAHTIERASQVSHPSKHLDDVKFAMSVVASGKLSEVELSESLSNWTVYGRQTLAEHLIEIGKITKDEANDLAQTTEDSKPLIEGPGISHAFGKIENNSALSSGSGEAEISHDMSRFVHTLGLGNANPPDESQVRRVGGEYRLIRKLGQGGLGSVWLARDEVLDRSVALKELTSDIATDSAVERFRREARLTGQLDHPNIVTVHQFGTDEETGKAFYAMRFVGKKTLGDAITEYHDQLEAGQDGVAELNQILSAFQMVCQAIAFAHSRGVVHRDLKPDNVALDSFGQVSVIDWGLAKSFNEPEYLDFNQMISGDPDGFAGQTIVGQIIGTPVYMSPEQAAGRVDEIDERTDVYGLGTILYQILAGRPPHTPGSVKSGDPARVQNILETVMKTPTPSVKDVRPDAPAELVAICSKAMARKKTRRYSSATELAEAVKNWVDGIADRTRRFELLKSQAREIEMRVTAAATAISRDARFASSLPPVQGIVDAIENRDESTGLDQWRSRLETIFGAILRTNLTLHSLSFSRVTDKEVDELVRVQRNAGDKSFIHNVPLSRLTKIPRTTCFDRLQMLDPGDVDFSIRPYESQQRRSITAKHRLSAWTPIFDEKDGQLFGVVTVEVDLENVILDFLLSLDNVSNSIYVVEEFDNLWVTRHEKSHQGPCSNNKAFLLEQSPGLATVFNGEVEILELESELVARRFSFGLEGLGFPLYVVCIV